MCVSSSSCNSVLCVCPVVLSLILSLLLPLCAHVHRSLVALSLILSLLLFKPAPLYILDEVDAALDLSHTQNVGQMIKTHFKHSQFIVVSLKDGMFTNANVLFKTKFVDGKSTVTRFLNPKVAAVTASDKKHKKGTTQGKRTVVK